MSGIYIHGVEMPTSCWDCLCHGDDYGETVCAPLKRTLKCYSDSPCFDDCPLVPVPPHGRLIDADALMEYIKNALGCYGNEYQIKTTFGALLEYIKAMINDAPTIIEADREDEV